MMSKISSQKKLASGINLTVLPTKEVIFSMDRLELENLP